MIDQHHQPQNESEPSHEQHTKRPTPAAGSGYFGPDDTETGTVEQRVSMLALFALLGVFASMILGCGGLIGTLAGLPVAWGVFVGPVVGLLSSACAFIALRVILTSGGRVMGRFPALLALFVGLGITTLTGFTAIAAGLTASASKNLAPIVSDVAIGSQAGRRTLALRNLSTAAQNELTQERLERFGELLQRELGVVTGASAEFDIVIGSRRVLQDSPGAYDITQAELADLPRPVWLRYTDGAGQPARVIAYVSVDLFDRESELAEASQAEDEAADDAAESTNGVDDSDASGDGDASETELDAEVRPFTQAREASVIVSDIAVIVSPNRAVLLRERGPAFKIAELIGWEIVED